MKKVLIVSLDNIGDTVLSLAVHDALMKTPGTKLAFWTKNYSREIVTLFSPSIQHFDCDPFWDKSPGAPKGGVMPFLKTLIRVRAERFDAAIILHANWRKNLACLLAGIPVRFAAAGAFASPCLNLPQRSAHVLETARRLVEGLTGSDPGPLRCSIPAPAPAPAGSPLAVFDSDRWAVLHPFSGNPRRNLTPKAWAEAAAGLAARGFSLLINASPREKEVFLAAAGGGAPAALFSCDAAPSVSDLAYAISRAGLFAGNNSGPLHLASALGTPCVGVYEERDVAYIEPRGARAPRLLVFKNSPFEISAGDVLREAALAAEPAAV